MFKGTSPSITAVGAGYEIAFQSNAGSLWAVGAVGNGNLGFGMFKGTSPSIIGVRP